MCRITITGQGVEITGSVRRLIESDPAAFLEQHGGPVALPSRRKALNISTVTLWRRMKDRASDVSH